MLMKNGVASFDDPKLVACQYESTQSMFNRHYETARKEGYPAGKAETEAAIRTIQERAREVATVLHAPLRCDTCGAPGAHVANDMARCVECAASYGEVES
jgi:hypothetical protein